MTDIPDEREGNKKPVTLEEVERENKSIPSAGVITTDAAGEQEDSKHTGEGEGREKKPRKSILRVSTLLGGPRKSSGGSTATTQSTGNHPQNKGSGVRKVIKDPRRYADKKIVGLKDYGLNKSTRQKRRQMDVSTDRRKSIGSVASLSIAGSLAGAPGPQHTVEDMEDEARSYVETNAFVLLFLGNLAAVKVMGLYLVTLETVMACILTVGLTIFWYRRSQEDENWYGGGMDFIVLAFVVVSPIATAIGMAFTRRERALMAIADFRSFSQQLFLAHCVWDWTENGGRAGAVGVDWVEHCDAVMAQLIGIGDELSRFLSLPNASRSRHRMTRSGRKEAKKTMEVAYHLLESMSTQRMTRLSLYGERLKKVGLPSGEVSRVRQYERFLSVDIEQLRMVKMYRTPQALRSFARVFTVFLPPFYAPTYAQVAKDVQSLGMGITFGIFTCLGLTALFESLQVLEDPFTAFLTLDGIDVREELEVLQFAQLVSTRRLVFPDAPEYPIYRRAALPGYSSLRKHHIIGLPPMQGHHHEHHRRVTSVAGADDSTIGSVNLGDIFDVDLNFNEEPEVAELGQFIPADDETVVRETVFSDNSESEEKLPARLVRAISTGGPSHRRLQSSTHSRRRREISASGHSRRRGENG